MNATFSVLLTIVPPPPSRADEDARMLLKEEGIPTFETSIKRLVAFERAPLEGVIVRDYADPRAEMAWAGYAALGKEVLNMEIRSE